MKHLGLGLLLGLASACSNDDATTVSDDTRAGDPGTPTFYQHVAPIFESKCVGCHQEGGIAPFSLNDYAAAKERASQIAAYTADRVMPPYLLETGGACGDFDESVALSEEQIQTIGEWARGGALEGTPVTLELPALPTLDGATEFSIPVFTPQITGGPLAQFDEYRCFPVPMALDADTFVTGYDVVPGNSQIVHHVLAFIVDPGQMTATGQTNQEVMDELHATDATPDRDGYECFGMAGNNVEVEAAPVVWAPGQGVVNYPGGLGVSLKQGRQLVIQVHYNLADGNVPAPDQTKVQLQLAPSVARQGVFLLEDALLGTLFRGAPFTLPPGQASIKYDWELSGADAGIPPGLNTEIVALFPHMHGRGHKYTFELAQAGEDYSCQGQVNAWDFNWQRVYDYTTPLPFNADSKFRVTCDYDTSADTMPVAPGWGTRNEMCFVMLMLALPPGVAL